MKQLTLLSILVLSLGLVVAACSGSDADTGNTGTADTTGGTDDTSTGTVGDDAGASIGDTSTGNGGGNATACELMEIDHSAELGDNCDDPSCPCGVVVNTVTGKVSDGDGAPIAGAMAQICSRSARDLSSVCLTPVSTGDDGGFTVSVPEENSCLIAGVMRALAPNMAFSTAYCTYESADMSVTGGILDLSSTPATLHATTLSTTAPASDDAYDWGEPYTVAWNDGLEIDITADWLFNNAVGIKDLSAVYIEGTDHLCNSSAISGAPGTWAFSPEGDGFEIRFPARIPDKLGLADGTAVNLFIQGGIGHTIQEGEEKTECEEGTWTHFACATVEGGVITLDDTNGIPAIGWLTYAPAE